MCIINANAQNVAIVESQSFQNTHAMDTVWKFVANSAGYNPNIVPQSSLDDISNLSFADILIVSSCSTSSSTQHIQTILDFVNSGRSVYIQSEHHADYAGSIAFKSIMESIGVSFKWTTEESGNLTPMNILGSLSTTPNVVSLLGGFYYGLAGEGGDEIEKFMLYNGNYFGFIYSDSTSSSGTVITVSDQDWIRSSASLALMENILYKLDQSTSVGIFENDITNEVRPYPNPTAGDFTIDLKGYNNGTITVIDLSGKIVQSTTYKDDQKLNLNIDKAAGEYLLVIESNDKKSVVRVVKK